MSKHALKEILIDALILNVLFTKTVCAIRVTLISAKQIKRTLIVIVMTNHVTGVGDAKIVFLSSFQKIEPSHAASTQTGSIIASASATNAMKNL